MTGIGLNSNDYLAITKALDSNSNNRIDEKEAIISYKAHSKIGNSNGVAGTKELALSLEKGDVFLKRITPESADKIADYFSKRNKNIGKKPIEWVSDAWISKEDLTISDDLREKIDTNFDGKISKKEFATALVNGIIVIGKTDYNGVGNSIGKDPFSNKPIYNDPFSNKDPFTDGPINNKPIYNDPFSNKPSNDISSRLNMVKSLYSDTDKAKILNSIANDRDLYLTPNQEEDLIKSTMNNIYSETTKTSILKNIINNKLISTQANLYMITSISSLYSDYNKTDLFLEMTWKKLSPEVQRHFVDNVLTMYSESSKVKVLSSLIDNQYIDNSTKNYLLDRVNNNFYSNSNKLLIYNKLFGKY
ncbi:MAG: hypothetical protein KatS3mg068_0505 [Candidatus Sericytochromatia bacterium]|nr:MAG: hypothetical protein KatS3mg068_0505 [Candidatus Sericytochromatia bacterium]